ncbi:MAG: hypothetical protein HZC54_21280 [Verrucomicrobia bacterium]|nr:hypothetical protein [Verrucomicrobiota bacterium]
MIPRGPLASLTAAPSAALIVARRFHFTAHAFNIPPQQNPRGQQMTGDEPVLDHEPDLTMAEG